MTVLFATSLAYAVPNLTVLWEKEYSDPYGLHQTCCAALNAFDVDHDGQMDIVIPFRKDSDRVMCVRGDNGAVKWVYPPMDQDGLVGGDPMGSPCIGDMDGDGKEEVLFTSRSGSDGLLFCIDAATGVGKWTYAGGGKDEAVCLYDVTGDGKKEAVYQGGDAITVVDYTGSLVWSYQMTASSSCAPNAFDIDKDGVVEILCGDGNGNLYCMSATGAEEWRFSTGDKFHHQQPVIGDFNNDGEYEIAVHSNDRYLYMLTFYGTEIWRYPICDRLWDVNEDAGKHEGGLAAADIDNDGYLEILTSDVIGNVYAVNYDGSLLWHYKLPEEVWTGFVIGDFTGDGQLDVIVEGEENETHAEYPYGCVMVLNGATGEEQFVWPVGLTASTPSAADFNGDGLVDIVAQAWSGPITVLTAFAPHLPYISTPMGYLNLWPWPYKYKTPSNNAVIEMAVVEPPVPWLTVEWQKEYETDYGLHQTCCAALNAFDVDHDGQMDIVIPFRKDSDRVMCVRGDNGAVKWVYPPMDQDGLVGGDPMGSPCIGDMDGDGKEEVLFTSRSGSDGLLFCIDAATGVGKWTYAGGGKDEAVCLYDVTGDGKKEAVYQGGDAITVVDYTGSLVWSYQMTASSSCAPNAFDIDKDGVVEILCGDGNGNLYCMSATGAEEWRFSTGDKFHHQQPVIGDFNNDGEYEIAVHSNDRYLYMLTFYGTEIWRYPICDRLWDVNEDAGKHEGGVAAGDLDGDGKWEILTSDVIGNVYCVNADGSLKWHYKTPEEIWTGFVICDFTGDGKLDVIVEGEENETNPYPYGMVAVLSGATGELQAVYPQGLTASTPSVGDFDNDGKIEIVCQAWSDYITVLTADGAYNPNLIPWGYKYKTPSNNAVYPMPECLLVLSAIGLLSFGIRARKRR